MAGLRAFRCNPLRAFGQAAILQSKIATGLCAPESLYRIAENQNAADGDGPVQTRIRRAAAGEIFFRQENEWGNNHRRGRLRRTACARVRDRSGKPAEIAWAISRTWNEWPGPTGHALYLSGFTRFIPPLYFFAGMCEYF
jgi:hypothetical protein